MTLHWEQPPSVGAVTVRLEPATGTPQELRRVMPNRTSWTIIYQGWNGPVEIPAPPAAVPAPGAG